MSWPPLVWVTQSGFCPPKLVGQVSAVTVFTVPVGNCAEALKHPKTENNNPTPTAIHKLVRIKIPSKRISLINKATWDTVQCENRAARTSKSQLGGRPEQLGGRPAPRVEKTKCISTFFRNKIFCILTES